MRIIVLAVAPFRPSQYVLESGEHKATWAMA